MVRMLREMTRVHASVLAACAALCAMPASAAATVAVQRGAHYGSGIFPDNAFTVPDRAQTTGRRVNFRQGLDFPNVGSAVQKACTSADYSICDAFAQLNEL